MGTKGLGTSGTSQIFCVSRVTTPWCDTWQMMPKGFDLSRFSRSNTPKIYPIPLYWLIIRAFRTAFFDQSTQLSVLPKFWVKWSKWQYLFKLETEKMSSTQNRKQKKWKTPKCPCISNTVIHCNSSNSSLYPYNVHNLFLTHMTHMTFSGNIGLVLEATDYRLDSIVLLR